MADDNALLLVSMENIGTKLDKIGDDVDYLKGETIRNEEWHKSLNHDLREVHDAVHGNGKPGLTTELRCIDDAVGDINTRLAHIEKGEVNKTQLSTVSKLEWLKGWRAVFFTAMTVLLSTIITLGIGGFFNRFLP